MENIHNAVLRTGQPGDSHPFQNYYRYLNQQRPLFQAFATLNRWPEFSTAMFDSGYSLYKNELKGKVQNSEMVATYIVSAHFHILLDWLLDPHPQTPNQMAKATTQLTRDGLLAGLGISQKVRLPS